MYSSMSQRESRIETSGLGVATRGAVAVTLYAGTALLILSMLMNLGDPDVLLDPERSTNTRGEQFVFSAVAAFFCNYLAYRAWGNI